MATRQERQRHAMRNNPAFVVERYADGPVKRKSKDKLKEKRIRERKADVTTRSVVVRQERFSTPVVARETERRIKRYSELAAQVKATGSVFGIKKRDIMMAVEEGNIDQAVLSFTRQAYSTIVALIPIAERAYKKNKREHQAYVINALISQGRELAADLTSIEDRTKLGETLVREILEPLFKNILQQLMQERIQMKAMFSDKIKPEYVATVSTEMDASLKRLAGVMNLIYTGAREQINKKLLGD